MNMKPKIRAKFCKGWKVLLHGRKSLIFRRGNTRNGMIYKVNVKTYPKLKNSKLFFFKYKGDAENFSGDLSYRVTIVPCIASNPIKAVALISSFLDSSEIESYWSNKKLVACRYPPDGTYFADAIKCLG